MRMAGFVKLLSAILALNLVGCATTSKIASDSKIQEMSLGARYALYQSQSLAVLEGAIFDASGNTLNIEQLEKLFSANKDEGALKVLKKGVPKVWPRIFLLFCAAGAGYTGYDTASQIGDRTVAAQAAGPWYAASLMGLVGFVDVMLNGNPISDQLAAVVTYNRNLRIRYGLETPNKGLQ